MTDPRAIDFSGAEPVSHDPGVTDHEIDIDGIRWALVEYSPGSGREGWCDVPHSGYVVSGRITYGFEDDSDPLEVGTGQSFVLPSTPRHRGSNYGDEPARLFLIDAVPG